MDLTYLQSLHIVSSALPYLDREYAEGFGCVDFVRRVYKECGIELPLLLPTAPPKRFNISPNMLEYPPIGALIFLKDPQDSRERAWTHVVIVLPERKVIHCSIFFGRKVVISSLDEIFARYVFAPSEAAP